MWGSVSRDTVFAATLDTSKLRLTRGAEASVQACNGHIQHGVDQKETGGGVGSSLRWSSHWGPLLSDGSAGNDPHKHWG